MLHSMSRALITFPSFSGVGREAFLHSFQLVNYRWEATHGRKEGVNTVGIKLVWKMVHLIWMCGFTVLLLLREGC